jgi:PAS domain S-box-containing protein
MSKNDPINPLVAALQAELTAADPALASNADLLRSVLSGSGDCIKILDLQGRLQFMSEGGKRVMEVDDFSKLKGCPWPDFWHGRGNTEAAEAVRTAIAGGTARFRGPADTARGNPRFWDVQVSPIFGGDGKPSHLLSISRDITEEWQAAERQRFLTLELKHRVKNTLANVISIANQTFKGDAHRMPLAAFEARLVALDRTHDLLTAANWEKTSLRTVIETCLQPHMSDQTRVRIEGPTLYCGPRQALAFGLAINELATNAVKYGALQSPDATIDIAWSEAANDTGKMFHWSWQESGGPTVIEPERMGFGSLVIKNLLGAELNGVTEITYAPAGLICRVSAPTENLTA